MSEEQLLAESGEPLSKILAPIDFSEASEMALRHALHLAHRTKASLKILHVSEPTPCPPGTNVDHYLAAKEAHAEKVREDIAALVARLWKEPFNGRWEAVCVEGIAADEIVAAAEEAELIVIATHGLSGFKRFVLGSTVDKIIRRAPCSVLVVKEKQPQS